MNNMDIGNMLALIQKMKNGNSQNTDEIIKNLKGQLSSEQQSKINSVMSDKAALKKLLESKEAAEILKRLNQKK